MMANFKKRNDDINSKNKFYHFHSMSINIGYLLFWGASQDCLVVEGNTAKRPKRDPKFQPIEDYQEVPEILI